METSRLSALLRSIRGKRILVVGDFFLDKYLVIDPSLQEISLETGHPAHQVVEVRTSPGGAGTVTSNLRALGVDTYALGLRGEDGEGWDLTEGLEATGVHTDGLLATPGHMTGTYIKPIRRSSRDEEETERLDIRRRRRLDSRTVKMIIARLRDIAAGMDAMIAVDAVPDDFGVIGEKVRKELEWLGRRSVMVVDSRRRSGLFSNVILKPNIDEAAAAAGTPRPRKLSKRWFQSTARTLYEKSRQPVFITASARGIFVFDGNRLVHSPALPPRGKMDIVGAGDCVAAVLCAALCAGGTLEEAAEIANLAASVVVHKLGVTGTASATEILRVHQHWRKAVHLQG